MHKKPALTYLIENIGLRSDGRSRYGLVAPLWRAVRKNVMVGVFLFAATPAHATVASWYDCAKPGECSRHKITASGERFNANALTAAHRTLPFGTRVRVTHKGRSVVVRINDRGPFIRGRSLDLSRAAARKIGCGGVCRVKMTVIGQGRAR